jgi:hypothetical protein
LTEICQWNDFDFDDFKFDPRPRILWLLDVGQPEIPLDAVFIDNTDLARGVRGEMPIAERH